MTLSTELSLEIVLTTSGLEVPNPEADSVGLLELSLTTTGHTLEDVAVLSPTTVSEEARTAWPSLTTSTGMVSSGTMLPAITENPSFVRGRQQLRKAYGLYLCFAFSLIMHNATNQIHFLGYVYFVKYFKSMLYIQFCNIVELK